MFSSIPSSNNNIRAHAIYNHSANKQRQHHDQPPPPLMRMVTEMSGAQTSPMDASSVPTPSSRHVSSSFIDGCQPNKQATGAAAAASAAAAAEAAAVIFPQKLMEILNAVDPVTGRPRFYNVIRWTDDGKAFKIEDRITLASNVLPIYFGAEGEFRSFTRRLLRWGFRRILNKGSDSHGAFFHKEFQRDKPELCRQIQTKEQIKMAIKRNNQRMKDREQMEMAIKRDSHKKNEEKSTPPSKDVQGKTAVPITNSNNTPAKSVSASNVEEKKATDTPCRQREAAMLLVQLSDGGDKKKRNISDQSTEEAEQRCGESKDSPKGETTKDEGNNHSPSFRGSLLNNVSISRNKKLKKGCGHATEFLKLEKQETTTNSYLQKPFVDVTTFPFSRVQESPKQLSDKSDSKEFEVDILSMYKDTLRKKQEEEERRAARKEPASNPKTNPVQHGEDQSVRDRLKVARTALMAQLYEKECASLEHRRMHEKHAQERQVSFKSIDEFNGQRSNGRNSILEQSMAYLEGPGHRPLMSSHPSSAEALSSYASRGIPFEGSRGIHPDLLMPRQDSVAKPLSEIAPVHNSRLSEFEKALLLSHMEKVPDSGRNSLYPTGPSRMEINGMSYDQSWLEGAIEEKLLKEELERLLYRNQQMERQAAFEGHRLSSGPQTAGMQTSGHEIMRERLLQQERMFAPFAREQANLMRHQQVAPVNQSLSFRAPPSEDRSSLLTVSQILADRIAQSYK